MRAARRRSEGKKKKKKRRCQDFGNAFSRTLAGRLLVIADDDEEEDERNVSEQMCGLGAALAPEQPREPRWTTVASQSGCRPQVSKAALRGPTRRRQRQTRRNSIVRHSLDAPLIGEVSPRGLAILAQKSAHIFKIPTRTGK